MMLVLLQVLETKTKNVYYTNTLTQAPLDYDKEAYINLLHVFGIKIEGEYKACLNCEKYGMVQFPKRWFDMIYRGLQAHGMTPSEHDPFLFVGDDVIYVIYVNYCLLFSKEDKYIDALVDHMQYHKFELDNEDQNITDFLGLDIPDSGTSNEKTSKFTMDRHINPIMVLTCIKYFNQRILWPYKHYYVWILMATLAKKLISGAMQPQ